MTPKQVPRGSDQGTVPTQLPETTPNTGADVTSWLLQAVNASTATLGRIEAEQKHVAEQVSSMNSKIEEIATEVRGVGKWVHTVKYALTFIGLVLTWIIAGLVIPWAKAKFFTSP